jgi:outer membrane biosynthesis protein TonB
MKLPAMVVVCLLPLVMTGCLHKTDQTQTQKLAPPVEDAPPPKPVPTPTDLPPTVISEPAKPAEPATQTNQTPKTTDATQAKPPVHHRKPASNTTQVASNSSGVSAIGHLSSGESDSRSQTLATIGSTERGLNAINRPLNDQERKTAAQIRAFLKQARSALGSGDLDGAHTLAAKAHVLLGELTK